MARCGEWAWGASNLSRILFLSQLLPYPPDAGPKVRSYFTLRQLCKNHCVTLLAFTRPDDRPESIEHLKEFCEAVHTVSINRSRVRDVWKLAASILTGQSFVISRDEVPAMAQKIEYLVHTTAYDFVHADQLWMAQYALKVRSNACINQNTRFILDEHNACYQVFKRLAQGESNPFKRILLNWEQARLADYEAQTIHKFHDVICVTQEDQAALQNLAGKIQPTKTGSGGYTPNFFTIPICVDAQSVQPLAPLPSVSDILYVGTMYYTPNIEGVLWFAREVWPRVAAQVPKASFTIIGKNPPKIIKNLAIVKHELPAVKHTEIKSSICVTGYVPDLRPYLERAAVFIVPLLAGGGMRVKIVDAWRWGLPVVSTAVGAEGLDYRDGENILIAKDAGEFAQKVIQVLCDPELACRLRENGRRWAEEHYDWQKVYPAWDKVYEETNN
jgi:polysaccharide biosynthesis protein PslH